MNSILRIQPPLTFTVASFPWNNAIRDRMHLTVMMTVSSFHDWQTAGQDQALLLSAFAGPPDCNNNAAAWQSWENQPVLANKVLYLESFDKHWDANPVPTLTNGAVLWSDPWSGEKTKNWRSYLMWIHRPGFETKLYHSTPYPSIRGRGEGKGPLFACILPSQARRRQVEVDDLNLPPHCHYSGGCTYPLSHLPGPALCTASHHRPLIFSWMEGLVHR